MVLPWPSLGSLQRNASIPCSPPRGGPHARTCHMPVSALLWRRLTLVTTLSLWLFMPCPSSHDSAPRPALPSSWDSNALDSAATTPPVALASTALVASSCGERRGSARQHTPFVGAPQHQQIRQSWCRSCYAHSAKLTSFI